MCDPKTPMRESNPRRSSLEPVRTLASRYPFTAFALAACFLSWWLVPIVGTPLGSGPFLAALLVVGLAEGRTGVRDLFRRMLRWRVGWRWYAIALLLPAAAAGLAAWLTVGLGAAAPGGAQLAGWTEVPFTFLLFLFVPLFGPWEEPGLRGFALSTLSGRAPLLVAGIAVGVFHVFWHLPLFISGDIPTADVVYILAASVVFAWLVAGSGGSVFMAMLMHASSNAVSGEFISPMFAGGDSETLGWIRAGIWVLCAIGVVLVAGRGFVTGSVPRAWTKGRRRHQLEPYQ